MSLKISGLVSQSQSNRQSPVFKGAVFLNTKKVSPEIMDKFITEVVEVSSKSMKLKTCGFKNWLGIAFDDSVKALEQVFVKKVKTITPDIEYFPKKTCAGFEKMIQDGSDKWATKRIKKLLGQKLEKPEKPEKFKMTG